MPAFTVTHLPRDWCAVCRGLSPEWQTRLQPLIRDCKGWVVVQAPGETDTNPFLAKIPLAIFEGRESPLGEQSRNPLPSQVTLFLRNPSGQWEEQFIIDPTMSESSLRQLILTFANYLRLKDEHHALQAQRNMRLESELLGNNLLMRRLRQQILAVSQGDWPVLIRGEAGTGRTLTARLIHDSGTLRNAPCVQVDCRTLTAAQFIDVLRGQTNGRGHEPGLLLQAAEGTLVIRELQALALPAQHYLAEVLRKHTDLNRKPQRFAEWHTRFVLTIQCVTEDNALRLLDRSLAEQLAEPQITVPALAERPEDLGQLAAHFLGEFAHLEGRFPKTLTPDGLAFLREASWPGNVRELKTVLERACWSSTDSQLGPEQLRPWMSRCLSQDMSFGPSLADMERWLIESTFARCGGNRELTAGTLQIGLRTLSGKLREYGYPPRGGPESKNAPNPVSTPITEPQRRAA